MESVGVQLESPLARCLMPPWLFEAVPYGSEEAAPLPGRPEAAVLGIRPCYDKAWA